MLKVVLQYTDCLQDGRRVFQTLALHNVVILKTRCGSWSTKPKITIVVRDYIALNELVSELNRNCYYEVCVVKTKMIKEKQNDKQRKTLALCGLGTQRQKII